MCIKPVVKRGVFVAIASWVALLSACGSHTNPLQTVTPKVAATFLVHASQAAEKTLRIFRVPGGDYYGQCMRWKAKKRGCKQVYKAMVKYANTTHRFHGMTMNDVTDKRCFKKLKADYEREQFNAV